MIDKFLNIFKDECIATIEGLTGQTPELSDCKEYEAAVQTGISTPLIMANISTSEGANSKIFIGFTPSLITGINDLMFGEEEPSGNTDIGNDELDAAKEIFQNIFSAISTNLGAQKELPKLNFEITKVEFQDEDITLNLDIYKKLYIYPTKLMNLSENIALAVDSSFLSVFGGLVQDDTADKQRSALEEPTNDSENDSPSHLNQELKNIGLIMDVKLPIRVRIGSKKMLLKDVLSMDIGSVIELNQLANDPLEVLIGDKPVALGEVVIIDGNFGVQITEIGSKKERLEQLK